VEGFVVDPADNKVTHVLLQEGHMWGRKEVAIPVSAVASIDADREVAGVRRERPLCVR